jgi:hypothetical protein
MLLAALPFFHDGIYYLRNPGDVLDSVSQWSGLQLFIQSVLQKTT